MLSLKEIYKSIDNLNGTLDSKESDDLLLKYMKWLCHYEDFNKAEELIAKLSPWNISSWENMLRDFKKDPNSFGEEYLKSAKEQKNLKKLNNTSIDYMWSIVKLTWSHQANQTIKDDYYNNLNKMKNDRPKRGTVKIKWKASPKLHGHIGKKDASKRVLPEDKRTIKRQMDGLNLSEKPAPMYNMILSIEDDRIVRKWHIKWRKKVPVIESFIFLWMSFNAFYDVLSTFEGDRASWIEIIRKQEVQDLWIRINQCSEIQDFLTYLEQRDVHDSSWVSHGKWGLWDSKNNIMFSEWYFSDDLEKYIWVIYRVRNNLLHWWKVWWDSDIELLKIANRSFLFFLDSLYWFHE